MKPRDEQIALAKSALAQKSIGFEQQAAYAAEATAHAAIAAAETLATIEDLLRELLRRR